MKPFVGLIAATLLLAGCASRPSAGAESGAASSAPPLEPGHKAVVAAGEPMPPFRYRTMQGGEIALEDYRGKVLIVDVFSPS